MDLIDFLPPENVRANVFAQSKKRALEIVSGIASAYLGNSKLTFPILEAMLNRERLGSTSIGHGVGIPHCRLNDINEPLAILITLNKGIDYQGIDNQSVDIILALLTPRESNELHIGLLARIAEQFSRPSVLKGIRGAESDQILYDIIANLPHD